MKKTFLEAVAHDMLGKYGHNLSRTAVVFPNKRASLFLNECLVGQTDRPIWSPAYITISDLFRQHSPLVVADSIKLVCDLHKSFVSCTGMNESLDHFYGWGQLLLSDFDDIDKNMADARKVYCNLKDLHAMDDLSYLTDEQKALLREFFHNFDVGNESELKRRFEQLWSKFFDIYDDFNRRLASQGLAYEGALYRQVVADESLAFDFDHYLFVGFNMVQTVEQQLFRRLQEQGKAHFYWDFDDYYMPQGSPANVSNEAGHYIAQYLQAFPNELDTTDASIYQNFRQKKSIRYVSAKTESIQAKFAGEWLKQGTRIADGRATAVVLCNENILQQVLHSLPGEVEKVNITTGYPLAGTPVVSLVEQLIDLQSHGLNASTGKYSLRHVAKVLSHPYLSLMSEEALPLLDQLNSQHRYYPERSLLTADDALQVVFADVAGQFAAEADSALPQSSQHNVSLLRWVRQVLQEVGRCSRQLDDALLQESVFQAYMLLGRLETLIAEGDLCLDLITLQRLLRQLVATTSIPFHGEPAIGTQIMGVLETRNLDFDHVLLLSCNEGNLPKGINDASFIPYIIRRAHGLTTIDNKVAIYSYYFHRLLQRATDITITYNNSTADGHASEMSRFMLQLLVESGQSIRRLNLQTENTVSTGLPQPVEKSEAIMQRLLKRERLSPSAINTYLRCPLRFYFNTVCGIEEPDATDGTIDNRMFGNIFHRAAYLIYEPYCHHGSGEPVTKEYLEGWLNDEARLLRTIDQAFNDELFKANSGRQPEYNGLQIINRRVIAMYLRNLLQTDLKLTPFHVLGLEQRCAMPIGFTVDGQEHCFNVGGIIDRMDIVTDAAGQRTIRIIDYKTGRALDARKQVDSVADVFDPANIEALHTDYFLQTMLYASVVAQSEEWNPDGLKVSPALLFIRQTTQANYDPTLSIHGERVADIRPLRTDYMAHLRQLLTSIFNRQLPFMPTEVSERCSQCPFAKVCHV